MRRCVGNTGSGYYADVRHRIPEVKGPVLRWFQNALRHPDHKWMAAGLLLDKPEAARPLVRELMEAAVHELDPSYNRAFIRPLVGAITKAEAIDLLINIGDGGGDLERGGVGRASYWVSIHLPGRDAEAEIRLNSWKLKTFLESDDVVAQRCLITGLRFEDDALSNEALERRDEAIKKARTHPDEYIRHRLQIQLGEISGPLMCLVTEDPVDQPVKHRSNSLRSQSVLLNVCIAIALVGALVLLVFLIWIGLQYISLLPTSVILGMVIGAVIALLRQFS